MEVLKIFAWPLAAIVISVTGLLLFKLQLAALLARTKSFGKEGWLGIDVPSKSQANVEVPSEPQALALPSDSFLITNLQTSITKDLKTRQIVEGPAREAYLIRLAAEAQLGMVFEILYSLVYGSQLAVLQMLNTGPQSTANVHLFYAKATEVYPSLYQTYTFAEWLGWLQNVGHFVIREGDMVSIAAEGREFLKFVVGRGYSLFKNS